MVFLATDIGFFICLFLFLLLIRFVKTNVLRGSAPVILQTPYLVVSLFIFCIMLVIAFLDSLHFAADGFDMKGGVISLFDLIMHPLDAPLEVSYSEPMSHHLYSISTQIQDDGSVYQRYEMLHYARDIPKKVYLISIAIGFIASALSLLCAIGVKKHSFEDILRGKTILAWRSIIISSFIFCSVICWLYLSSRYLHILGTSKIGSDVFFIGLKSIRTGFVIGSLSLLFMIPFAIFLGISAGYFGSRVDSIIQFIYITLSSIPGILLIASALLATDIWLIKQTSWTGIEKADLRLLMISLVIGITGWTPLCRLLRAEAMKIREMDYILVAKLQGRTTFSMIFREILPNVIHLVMIVMILDFSGLVLAEAILSYIGVGVDPSTHSWGNMINSARLELARDPIVWWPLVTAFVMMFLLVLSANLLADRLTQVLDPKKRGDY